MREKKYKEANTDFIEAFKNFDEGGAGKGPCARSLNESSSPCFHQMTIYFSRSTDATACLKYLVLANLLSGSDINPFDDNRAKASVLLVPRVIRVLINAAIPPRRRFSR